MPCSIWYRKYYTAHAVNEYQLDEELIATALQQACYLDKTMVGPKSGMGVHVLLQV